jgi:FdhD protein
MLTAPHEIIAATKQRQVTRLHKAALAEVDDCLIVEEPLEIRIDGRRYTATMRTPGHDLELARGLLFTEGVIQANDDIEEMTLSTRCREQSIDLMNIVDVVLHDSSEVSPHLWERSLISNSSCGLCGKASIEAITTKVSPLLHHRPFKRETLLRLPHLMRDRQSLFQQTGGLHACGIFDRNGRCLALFEDIGRHNATDKAIGFGLEQGWLPWNTRDEPLALLVSGRGSFEITQKALMARIPVVCSVSAASTLAVELAEANNQTLIGFLREAGMTIYCGASRVLVKQEEVRP